MAVVFVFPTELRRDQAELVGVIFYFLGLAGSLGLRLGLPATGRHGLLDCFASFFFCKWRKDEGPRTFSKSSARATRKKRRVRWPRVRAPNEHNNSEVFYIEVLG